MFPSNEQAKTRLRECQTGQRLPLGELDIIYIDISEFPFHRTIEPVQNSQFQQDIAVPKPIFSIFSMNGFMNNLNTQLPNVNLPQKRAPSDIKLDGNNY
jgi:hypothetical protein